MTHVWIAQCLCPRRHAIMAAADAVEDADANSVLNACRAHVKRLLANDVLNPWCGLCRAPSNTWRYELGRTSWRTMAEALPIMRQLEADQRAVAAVLGDGDPL